MRRRSWADMRCPVAQTLDVVGDPWTLLIVREALFGPRRFDQLRDALSIPGTTLSARLDTLVEHGVLEARPYQDRPVRHEYVLTEKGRALSPVIVAMLRWGDEHTPLEGRPVRLVDADTGDELDPVYVDRVSGRPLDQIRVERRIVQ